MSLLSVLACGGAVLALQGLARSGSRARLERAEDAARIQVERLVNPGASAEPFVRTGRGPGLAGLLTADGRPVEPERPGPPELLSLRAEALHLSHRTGGVALRSTESGPPPAWRARWRRAGMAREGAETGTLVVAVGPLRSGAGWAWAAGWVPSPRGGLAGRVGVGALVLATALLIAVSLHALTRLQRGALGLRGTLDALARDLSTPVRRPDVRELATVADGIATMASTLRHSLDEREALRAELVERERLASLGRVAAGIAHEVRNPLAAIKLKIDLAAMDLPSTRSSTARDLAEVGAEIARLDRLVSDLLVIAGRRALRREPTDLAALARARCDLMAPSHGDDPGRFVVSGEGSAEVDRDGLTRVIDNLLRNACEASPAGAPVRVELAEGDRVVTLRVIDAGPGVDPGRQSELFEPFFTTRPEGTGLGLALSRAVVRAHGGSLRYLREDDRTVFSVELPGGAE